MSIESILIIINKKFLDVIFFCRTFKLVLERPIYRPRKGSGLGRSYWRQITWSLPAQSAEKAVLGKGERNKYCLSRLGSVGHHVIRRHELCPEAEETNKSFLALYWNRTWSYTGQERSGEGHWSTHTPLFSNCNFRLICDRNYAFE